MFQRDLSTTCCAPQPGCEHCKRSRRIAETYYEPAMERRWTRYVHLKEGGGFVDCAIQEPEPGNSAAGREPSNGK